MSYNSSSALIVGGCGLLGRRIVADFLTNSPRTKVSVLDAKVTSVNDKAGQVTYYEADICDEDAVESVIRKSQPDVIIDVASPRPFAHDLDFCMRVNVGGTTNLIEQGRRVGTLKAFVYTSSSSVVHDAISDMVNWDESARVLFLPEQKEYYHHSKAMAETFVLGANRKQGSTLVTCSLRPSGIFGPGDEQTVASMVRTAKEGKLKWQLGDGTNLFDWTYVDNVARAHVLAAECLLKASALPVGSIPDDKRVEGEAFFITNGQPYPFWDFARALGSAAGYTTDPKSIRVIPKSVARMMGYIVEWGVWIFSLGHRQATFNHRSLSYSTQTRVFNIAKARNRLGYDPSITVEEGIKRAVAPLVARQSAQSSNGET